MLQENGYFAEKHNEMGGIRTITQYLADTKCDRCISEKGLLPIPSIDTPDMRLDNRSYSYAKL